MKLSMPKGYEMPDNAKPGQPFEAVATLVMGEDGTVQLTAIDGMEVGESEEPEEAEEAEAPEAEDMAMPWNQPPPFE